MLVRSRARSLPPVGAVAAALAWLSPTAALGESAGEPAPTPAPSSADPYPVRPLELWLGAGYGDAVCDEKPSTEGSDCLTDGAFALNLGGLWRYSQRWGIGLELGTHSFAVNEAWRGTLDDPATDLELATSYLAAHFRWDPPLDGPFVAYVQFGAGAGHLGGVAHNSTQDYEIAMRGWLAQVGVGGEWYLGSGFRLGPQAHAYFLKGTTKCEITDGVETCERARGEDAALPWRLSLQGTLLLDL